MSIKVGYDVSQTGRFKAGCGAYADGLLGALAAIDRENEYILYRTFGDSFWDPDCSEINVRADEPGSRFRSGLWHRTHSDSWRFWSNPPPDLEQQLGTPDVIHSNNFFMPRGVTRAKLVYTLYDLTFLDNPGLTTNQNWAVCFNGVFEASVSADLIVAISETSQDHFLKVFPHFAAERIIVAHPGPRFANRPVCSRPVEFEMLRTGQFWLNVGTIEPRKNQRALLRACARLKAAGHPPMPLVLAGASGWLVDDLRGYIGELGLAAQVLTPGYVSDDALGWLFRNCFGLVYPSISEGFGLPVLEAMAVGVPVVASDIPSIREIAGDTGVFVDPTSDESIGDGLLRLSSDIALQTRLRDGAAERSGRFSWHTTGGIVRRAYETVVHGVVR